MGRRTRKSVAALAGRPPACDPARPRSAGAGFGSEGAGMRHGIGHGRRGFRAWDATLRRLPGRSRGFMSGRRGGDEGAFPSRGATVLIGTAFPARSRPECAQSCRRQRGSPLGTVTVLRDTSVERRRQADVGLRREGGAPRVARRGGGCRKAGEGLGPAARVPGARRPAGPARRRGDPGPEVDKPEVRRAHRERRAHPGGPERGPLCGGAGKRQTSRNER